MEFLERFWPGLLGALLAGFFGYKMLSGSAAPVDRPLNPSPSLERGRSILEDEEARWEESPLERAARLEAAKPPQAEFQLVEKPILVERPDPALRTFTEQSPEVKEALSRVSIEILADPGSQEARRAAAYFEHNELEYSARDATDAMVQERARRLSGTREVGRPAPTVVLVDGRPLTNTSDATLQQSLKGAVRRRIEQGLSAKAATEDTEQAAPQDDTEQ